MENDRKKEESDIEGERRTEWRGEGHGGEERRKFMRGNRQIEMRERQIGVL